MSYANRFSGSWFIKGKVEKKLPAALVKLAAENKMKLVPEDGPGGLDVGSIEKLQTFERYFTITDYGVEADDNAEPGNAGYLDEDLDSLIDIANEAGYVLEGTIYRLGEESGDLERYTVADNVITVDKAKLVWESDNSPVAYELYAQ